MDTQVLLFAASTSMVGALLFGSLPAWQYSKPDLQGALKQGAYQVSQNRRSRWLRQCLLGTQIALTCVLLVGAALAGQTFWNTLNVALGVNSENVVTGTLSMSSDRYGSVPARAAFAKNVVEQIRRHPEVESVALSSSPPLSIGGMQYAFFPKGERVSEQDVQPPISTAVTPGYFDLLRIPFTSGQAFRDGESAIVINETFARQHWGDVNPLGSQINLLINGRPPRQFTVTGIVKDQNNAFFANFATPTTPQLFYPCDACAVVLVKGKEGSRALPSILRKEVAALDSTVPVNQLRMLDEALMKSRKWANPRFRSTLFTGFSLSALLLALAGAYGVTSYSAIQRRQEMGIRMTLGATHGQVIRCMLFESLRPVIVGLLIGLTAAWNLSRFAVAFLYNVNPTDPKLFGISALVLIIAAVVANLVPLQRMVRVDPLESLRTE
jgi:predicted permease